MIEASGLVQEAGLDAGVAPGSCISRVLRWWRRFDIVCAVHPQPLHDLYGVLLVSVRVGLRFLEERKLTTPWRCSLSPRTSCIAGTIWSALFPAVLPLPVLIEGGTLLLLVYDVQRERERGHVNPGVHLASCWAQRGLSREKPVNSR